MTYTNFKKYWTGRRVDYDNVYSYQCVDLILQYVKDCYALPSGVRGNAIDYWTKPSASLLKKFNKIATTACKQGDIVILRGLTGNPYGHIGVCDSNAVKTVRLLEQNAVGTGTGLGKDAINVYRDISKKRIAGILRPKTSSIPKPTPVYTTVKTGEGLSQIAKRAGYKDWWLPTSWQRISNLNGGGLWVTYNSNLKPGQKVRIG